MSAVAKTLIQNKEWILQYDNQKIGTISKIKKGFYFQRKNNKIYFKDLVELEKNLGLNNLDINNKSSKLHTKNQNNYSIYDYPCKSMPYNAVFNLRKRLPIYTKSNKSRCHFCAGHYAIKFRKNWIKSFSPKLITLNRYEYYGPFKTEEEVKQLLSSLNQNETT